MKTVLIVPFRQNDQTNTIQPPVQDATDKSTVFDYNKLKFGGKSTNTANRIAARLSPKSARRKITSKPVLFKVHKLFNYLFIV